MTTHTESLRMGRVALTVHDLDKVGAWYEKAVGLHRLSRDGEAALYGVGDEVLLELRQDKSARRRSPREAGLFHTAFLLPDRASLGQWIINASENRLSVAGVADHDVSEAIYLSDPEGNGVEIYADRPRDAWQWNGGIVTMGTEPLDVAAVAESAEGRGPWQGVPEGTTIGHVHLQVGALPEAEAFYNAALGLDVTHRYHGATFYAADGYHHHVATNIWNSRNAGPRNLPSTGLSEVEIILDASRAAAVLERTKTKSQGNARILLADPWNTPIALTVA